MKTTQMADIREKIKDSSYLKIGEGESFPVHPPMSKRSRRFRSEYTKPKVVVAVGGEVPVAEGDAGEPRIAVPITTADGANGCSYVLEDRIFHTFAFVLKIRNPR